jgi:anion-transporting  ArsA/GET3 family ATPase
VSTLHESFGDCRIIVTCGPGGIGKTTSAAALATAIATNEPLRVLVLTVDPARRLADALGVPGIGNEPLDVELSGAGTLSVAMLDPQASWDALIRRQAADEETAERILQNVLYQNITRRFVQSHDYIAMERLHELVGRGQWDLIVVDTPPTRNALDFLDAPTRMADFFSSRFLKWIIAPARSSVTSLAAKPLTYMADKILGNQFLTDITEFFLLLSSLYDGFVERAREVESLLAEESTKFLIVSTPEPIPTREATFFNEELQKRSLRIGGWLVNRMLPASLNLTETTTGVAVLAREEMAHVADALGIDVATATAARDRMVAIAEEYTVVAERERAQLATLAAGDTPVFGAFTAEGEIDTLQGVTSFGQRLLSAERVLKFD